MRKIRAFGLFSTIVGTILVVVTFVLAYTLVLGFQQSDIFTNVNAVSGILLGTSLELAFLGIMVAGAYVLISKGLDAIRDDEQAQNLQRRTGVQVKRADKGAAARQAGPAPSQSSVQQSASPTGPGTSGARISEDSQRAAELERRREELEQKRVELEQRLEAIMVRLETVQDQSQASSTAATVETSPSPPPESLVASRPEPEVVAVPPSDAKVPEAPSEKSTIGEDSPAKKEKKRRGASEAGEEKKERRSRPGR